MAVIEVMLVASCLVACLGWYLCWSEASELRSRNKELANNYVEVVTRQATKSSRRQREWKS